MAGMVGQRWFDDASWGWPVGHFIPALLTFVGAASLIPAADTDGYIKVIAEKSGRDSRSHHRFTASCSCPSMRLPVNSGRAKPAPPANVLARRATQFDES
jgi:hypothetical protein